MKHYYNEGQYRVVVDASEGGMIYAGNCVTYDTIEEAHDGAVDLWFRWTLVRDWAVIPVTCAPDQGNYWTRQYPH